MRATSTSPLVLGCSPLRARLNPMYRRATVSAGMPTKAEVLSIATYVDTPSYSTSQLRDVTVFWIVLTLLYTVAMVYPLFMLLPLLTLVVEAFASYTTRLNGVARRLLYEALSIQVFNPCIVVNPTSLVQAAVHTF